MRKRILALLLSVAVIAQCSIAIFVIAADGDSETYSVAIPVSEKSEVNGSEVLHSEKLSNYTVAFDYTPSENSEVQLSYDFDTKLKKTAFYEDFEEYAVGDKYNNPTGNNLTVVSNSELAPQKNGAGKCGSVSNWKEGGFTPFKGGDYDASFWLFQNNPDWGKMTIHVKKNVYFAFIGEKLGGPYQTLGLYAGNATVNDISVQDNVNNRLLASFNFNDYGYSYNVGEVYYRITVTRDTVKMYISPNNDFEGLDPVINITLDSEYASDESMLEFAQGNTGLWVDNIRVIDINKDGYDTEVSEKRTYYKSYENNFDSDDTIVPDGVTLIDDSNGGKLADVNGTRPSTVTFCKISGNYILEMYIKSNNPDWDFHNIVLRDNLQLRFRGKYNTNTGAYSAFLVKGEEVLASTALSRRPCDGVYVRIEYDRGYTSVYLNSENKFSDDNLVLSADAGKLSNESDFTIYKHDALFYIDNITVYDFDNYESEFTEISSGEYGKVNLSNSGVSVSHVLGLKAEELENTAFKFKAGKTYRVVVMRDCGNMNVTVNGSKVINTSVPFDKNNNLGELVLKTEGAEVKNIKVYDSGRITFEERGAVLTPFSISEKIVSIASSANNNAIYSENEIFTASAGEVNGSVCSSAWLKESVADLVLDFNIKGWRPDWIEDRIFISAPSDVVNKDGGSYQYNPEALYKEGYCVKFGTNTADAPYYGTYNVVGGAASSISNQKECNYHWGLESGHVRIEKKGDKLRIYLAPVGEKLVLLDEIKISAHLIGNVYWYHRQGSASVMDIQAYDTANREDLASDNGNSEPTRLISFYSTTKTDKTIDVLPKAVSEKIGPWYTISNPHANAMNLQKSLTGDAKIRNMDMSFEYYSSGYWMTNTFYFASSDKYGTTSYALTVRGFGISRERGYNVELTRNFYGKSTRLGTAWVDNISDGCFKFHITIDNGKIKVVIGPKNAPDSDNIVLEGDSGGHDFKGGVYMYIYDECTVRLKDIVIYNGTDLSSAVKPDLSDEKTTIVDNDFEDASDIPVKQFKDDQTGCTVEHDAVNGRLHFDTNHNNYIQTLIEPKQDWLGDLTVQFDYIGHRGDWNMNWFGWHCSRKSGDRYSSIYLVVLGNLVAGDEKAMENIAKKRGANVQLVASEYGVKTCLGYASIPEINGGREYSFRMTQEGSEIKVWTWPTKEDMPSEPIITASNYHPDLCYGGLTIHSWCGNFSIDNLKILNYADYTIPKPSSIYNTLIGDIFRVDRVFEESEVIVEKPAEKTVNESEKSNLGLILGITVPIAAVIISGTVIFIVVYKKKKKSKALTD